MSENPEMSNPPPPPEEPPAPPPPPEDPPAPPPPPEDPPTPPPPTEPPSGGAADSNRTVMLVLAYLGPLALVPFLTEKDDGEVQWHAKHGLVLFVAEPVLFLTMGAAASLGPVFCLVAILWPVCGIGLVILHVLCIVKATKGERFLIPGLSPFADKF